MSTVLDELTFRIGMKKENEKEESNMETFLFEDGIVYARDGYLQICRIDKDQQRGIKVINYSALFHCSDLFKELNGFEILEARHKALRYDKNTLLIGIYLRTANDNKYQSNIQKGWTNEATSAGHTNFIASLIIDIIRLKLISRAIKPIASYLNADIDSLSIHKRSLVFVVNRDPLNLRRSKSDSIKPRRERDGFKETKMLERPCLMLASLSLCVYDSWEIQSSDLKIKIASTSESGGIITRARDLFYLHEYESKSKRLILKKILLIKNSRICDIRELSSQSSQGLPNPFIYLSLKNSTDKEIFTIFKLKPNLKLSTKIVKIKDYQETNIDRFDYFCASFDAEKTFFITRFDKPQKSNSSIFINQFQFVDPSSSLKASFGKGRSLYQLFFDNSKFYFLVPSQNDPEVRQRLVLQISTESHQSGDETEGFVETIRSIGTEFPHGCC